MPRRQNFSSEEKSEADAGWEESDPDNFDFETDFED